MSSPRREPALAGRRRRRRRWPLIALAALPLVAGVVVAVGSSRRDDRPGVVDIRSDAPAHATLGGLLAASDVVVVGVVRSVRAGRPLSARDGAPGQGSVVTQVAALDVEDVLLDSARSGELLEQVAATGAGRRVRLDGVEPVVAGDHLLVFATRGRGDDPPYLTLVNGQSLYRVSTDAALTTPGGDAAPWSMADVRQSASGCVRTAVCRPP